MRFVVIIFLNVEDIQGQNPNPNRKTIEISRCGTAPRMKRSRARTRTVCYAHGRETLAPTDRTAPRTEGNQNSWRARTGPLARTDVTRNHLCARTGSLARRRTDGNRLLRGGVRVGPAAAAAAAAAGQSLPLAGVRGPP